MLYSGRRFLVLQTLLARDLWRLVYAVVHAVYVERTWWYLLPTSMYRRHMQPAQMVWGVALRSNAGPATYVRGGPLVDAVGFVLCVGLGFLRAVAAAGLRSWSPWLSKRRS